MPRYLYIFLVLLIPIRADAYTDPGSGYLLLQSLLAAVAGGVLFFRNFISRALSFFYKILGKRPDK
jgi:hypothetical protein